jgi:hypothetical protein
MNNSVVAIEMTCKVEYYSGHIIRAQKFMAL